MRGVTVWDRVCLGLVSASHLSRDMIGPPWLTVAEGSSCYTQVPVLVPGWQTRTRQRVGVWLFLLALKELPRRGLRPTAFLWEGLSSARHGEFRGRLSRFGWFSRSYSSEEPECQSRMFGGWHIPVHFTPHTQMNSEWIIHTQCLWNKMVKEWKTT